MPAFSMTTCPAGHAVIAALIAAAVTPGLNVAQFVVRLGMPPGTPAICQLMLREGATWELAPAYDVTHAYNPQGEWTYQHLMSVNGKFAGISRDDLMAVADRFGVGTAPQVLKHVAAAVSSWPDFARAAKVSAAEVKRIREHHRLLLH